jgi:hypothetical protein
VANRLSALELSSVEDTIGREQLLIRNRKIDR